MRNTIIFALLILALVPALVLAQTSNTSNASAGQFTTDTDNFMSVTRWQAIPKDLLYVGLNSGILDLGYGADLSKDLYLGLYYNGYAFDTDPGTLTTTVNSTLILDNDIQVGETLITTDSPDEEFRTVTGNDLSVLVGFGTMGVKLYLDTNSYIWNDKFDVVTFINYNMTTVPFLGETTPNTRLYYPQSNGTANDLDNHSAGIDSRTVTYAADGVTLIDEDVATYSGGQYSESTLMANATWGMVMPMGKMTLRPFVTLGAGLRDNGSFKQSYAATDRAIGSGFPAFNEVEEVAGGNTTDMRMNRKVLAIEPTLGANIEMPMGSATTSFNVSYGLDLNLASNRYAGLDGTSVSAKGYAYDYHDVDYVYSLADTTTTDTRAFEVDTVGYQRHDLNLSAKYSKKLSDKVSLSASAFLPVTLAIDTSRVNGEARRVETYVDNANAANNYVDTTNKTYVRDSVKNTYTNIDPRVSAGLQWAAVRDLLTFNLGAIAYIPSFTSQVSTVTVPGFTSVNQTTVNADGSVIEQPNQNTLGSTRTETQTSTTEWDEIATFVRGGFNLNLGTGISLDMNCSVSATQITASTFSLQVQVRR